MDNRIFHAVLEAFGMCTSIDRGLIHRNTKYGNIRVRQFHDTLSVMCDGFPDAPSMTIHNVSNVSTHALVASLKLLFT